MKKLVTESLYEFQDSLTFLRKDIRNLMEDLGFETNDAWDASTPGFLEYYKAVPGGEITIYIGPKFAEGQPSSIIKMSAQFKKSGNLLKRSRYSDVGGETELDLGDGLFRMNDADVLEKITNYVEDIETQLVTESLYEFILLKEEKVKSKRKTKAGEKVVMDQSAVEKADQAIKALKKQLADAKKPGGMRDSKAGKDAKVKEIEDKIAKWEEKKKNVKGKMNERISDQDYAYMDNEYDNVMKNANSDGEFYAVIKTHNGEIKDRSAVKFMRENNIDYEDLGITPSGHPQTNTLVRFTGSPEDIVKLEKFYSWYGRP
jgi:hypothetical protein